MPLKARRPGLAILMTITAVSVLLVVVLLAQQPPAMGDSQPEITASSGANIIAVAVQIYPGSEAIALIDKDRQTLCLYQYRPDAAPHESFVLLAARSFRYDCLLENFNNGQPTPADIRKMVEKISAPQTTNDEPTPPDSLQNDSEKPVSVEN